MARGGARPGAGRPRKGAGAAPHCDAAPTAADLLPAGSTPLDYMLAVMLDATIDPLRRDRMAMAAAPFVHIRATDSKPTEKDEKAAKSKQASTGKFAAAPSPLKLVGRK